MATAIPLVIPPGVLQGVLGAATSLLTDGVQNSGVYTVDATETTITIANNDLQERAVLISIMGATPPAWILNEKSGLTTGGLQMAAKQPYTQRVPGGKTVTLYATATAAGTGVLHAKVL